MRWSAARRWSCGPSGCWRTGTSTRPSARGKPLPGKRRPRRREALPRPSWRPRAAGWPSSTRALPAGRSQSPCGPWQACGKGKQGMRASRKSKRKTDGRFSQDGCFLSKRLQGHWCPVGAARRFLHCRAGRRERAAPHCLKKPRSGSNRQCPRPRFRGWLPHIRGCHVLWDVFAIFFYRHTKEEHYARHCHHPRPVRFHPV